MKTLVGPSLDTLLGDLARVACDFKGDNFKFKRSCKDQNPSFNNFHKDYAIVEIFHVPQICFCFRALETTARVLPISSCFASFLRR